MEGYLSPIALITYTGILLILGLSTIRHRIAKAFVVLIGITTLISASIRIFPNYNQAPDLYTFFAQQKNQLIITSPQTEGKGYIEVTTPLQTQKIGIQAGTQVVGLISNPETRIAYIGSTTNNVAKVYREAKNGAVIELLPGTMILITGSIPAPISITRLQGKIQSYIPRDASQTTILNASGSFTPEGTIKEYINMFEQSKISFLRQSIGEIFLMSPLRQINKKILDILYTLRPQNYADNIANYNSFLQYIPETDLTVDKKPGQNLIQDISSQGARGREQTKIYQWIKNIF